MTSFAVLPSGEGSALPISRHNADPTFSPGTCVRPLKTNPGAFGHRGLFGGV